MSNELNTKMSIQYYVYCFIVFVTSSKGSKIYIIDISDGIESNPINALQKRESNFYPFYTIDVENGRSHQNVFMNQFISLLNNNKVKKNKAYNKKRITTCDRHFGSMFGTKLQKLQCISDRDKNKRFAKRTIKRFLNYFDSNGYERPMYNYQNHISKYVNKGNNFEDLTRGNGHVQDVTDLPKYGDSGQRFASNYVDVNDLRADFRLSDYTDNVESNIDEPHKRKIHTKKTHPIAGMISRKAGMKPITPKVNEIVRAATDESSVSSGSSEMKQKRQIKKYKKPKRFQVIKNSESNESGPKSISSSDSMEPPHRVASASESEKDSRTTSEEVPRKKHEMEVKKPILSDVDDKYVYIQGRNRQYGVNLASDTDSDADSRKRLQHFLPEIPLD